MGGFQYLLPDTRRWSTAMMLNTSVSYKTYICLDIIRNHGRS
jgi:hypothetical protein